MNSNKKLLVAKGIATFVTRALLLAVVAADRFPARGPPEVSWCSSRSRPRPFRRPQHPASWAEEAERNGF